MFLEFCDNLKIIIQSVTHKLSWRVPTGTFWLTTRTYVRVGKFQMSLSEQFALKMKWKLADQDLGMGMDIDIGLGMEVV